MTLRLLTYGKKGTGNPSMMMGRAGVSWDLVRVDLESMSRASVLLPFSFRKFLLIQLRMSSRQVMREMGGRWQWWVWRRCRPVCHWNNNEKGPHGDGGECLGGGGK